jgi:hypothetical protein
MRRIMRRRRNSGEHSGVQQHHQAEQGLLVHLRWGATRNERIDGLHRIFVLYLPTRLRLPVPHVKLPIVVVTVRAGAAHNACTP